ncbi:MAG: hypothetical protein Q7S37_01885 [bacterium]|nr:hypothetical protein [bacterium]
MPKLPSRLNEKTPNYYIIYGLIAIGVVARLLPHPANFAPISALALFSGAYLSRRNAIIIPLAAMLISDIFLGFHIIMPYVYTSFLIVALLGVYLKNNIKFRNIFALSLSGSLIFFIITNFGVWLQSGMYPHTLTGLASCFTLAIPFYRNTLLGDLVYTTAFFGIYAFVENVFFARKPNILHINNVTTINHRRDL